MVDHYDKISDYERRLLSTEKFLEQFAPDQDNLISILHQIQNRSDRNYISEEDMREVAEYLHVPYSTVYGVATYYSMFSVTPRGKHLIRVCNSPVCHMEGSKEVLGELKRLLGVDVGETTPDGMFTIEHTECLGRCGDAPALLVDETVFGGVNHEKLRSIIERYR